MSRFPLIKTMVGCLALVAALAPRIEASCPSVSFDVPAMIDVRDVTTQEFALARPGEKLIEACLPISALLQADNQEGLAELFCQILSPERTSRVVDYFPKTTLAPEYAGNVGVEERQEGALNFGLNAAGGYGPITAANSTLSATEKSSSFRRYELLPPLETIAASGTTQRGNGVYFKFRPTPRVSLEGAQQLLVIFAVPRDWRADYLVVKCQAFGHSPTFSLTGTQPPRCGQDSFLVGLFLAGDRDAANAVRSFMRSEGTLRRAANTHRHSIERAAAPTPVHELAIHLGGRTPRIPPTWLDQVLLGRDQDTVRFLGYLPAAVREPALDYLASRRELRQINRTHGG